MKRIITAFLAITGWAFGAHIKIAKDLDKVQQDSMVDVIVQFNGAPTIAHHAKVIRRGGSHRASLDVIKGGAYSVPANALADLANDSEVAYITPDRVVRGSLDNANPSLGGDVARSYGLDGTGIGVAILDSGVSKHQDLMNAKGDKSRIVYSQSFVGGGNDDHYGHGTHVAGIIGGNGRSSTGSNYTHTFLGLAPNVNIVNLRVLDDKGAGQDSSVISAIQQAIALKNTYNIRVLNLSLGRAVTESFTRDPLCQAVEAAWRAGIVVVVAAGNQGRANTNGTNGYSTIESPANDPFVITVGAMKTQGTLSRADDTIASYSSKGPTAFDHVVKPDLVAPGNRVISLLPSTGSLDKTYPVTLIPVSYYGLKASSLSNTYYRLSGTSIAAPMVTGAAAILLQKQPGLNPDQVKAILMKTSTKTFPLLSTVVDPATGITYQSEYDIFTIGAGYLDIASALRMNDIPPSGKSAISPLAVYDAATNMVYAVADATPICSNSALWGSSALWGTICGNSALWGSSALWGTSAIWGSSALWGTSAIWGSGAFLANPLALPIGVESVWTGPIVWPMNTASAMGIIWGKGVVWGTVLPTGTSVNSQAATVLINGEN